MAKSPSPSSRRAAREVALRVLYMIEVGKVPREQAQEETIAAHTLGEDAAEFARQLVQDTLSHQEEADRAIAQSAVHYPLERQTIVDRNILRLAAIEVLYASSGVAFGVVANEAVELAKKYSTPEAAKFVNGVLGGLIRSHQEALAAQEPTHV